MKATESGTGMGNDSSINILLKKPIFFHAKIDPMKVDYWLMDMERIFGIVDYDDQQKIKCALDTLKGKAQN